LAILEAGLCMISCFFEKDGVMASEISSISAGGAVAAAQRMPAAAPSVSSASAQTTSAIQKSDFTLPQKPAIALPKRPELQFNAAENRKSLQEAVSMLNEQVASHKNGLGFSISDSIDVPVVTVKNTVTGEVVRQIPNEVVIRVAQNIDTVQKGLLHNSKV
jgi:flagellar protein FlaG